MENQKKCSLKKHADINAISYCQECNKYMCNKCENLHNDLFEDHHKIELKENISEFFSGICKEPGHKTELEFYCKNHNKLCCACCISKIKEKDYGQHSECEVYSIEKIKEEKKSRLPENIKVLEDLSNKVENSINELKKIIEKINENKEELKLKIAKIFTQIRSVINQREDELLLEVDNQYNKLFIDDELIKKNKNLPNKIKKSIDKGNLINKDWDNNKIKLNSLINDCIDIENNIKDIKIINEAIAKFNTTDNKILFYPDNENEINDFLNKIKQFGDISDKVFKFKFKFNPGQNYSISNNGLTATKNNGNGNWNCTIIGDREIPKNIKSEWKIKITNFKIIGNAWNVLIGIGPNNPNNQMNFYTSCWTFICGQNYMCLKGKSVQINNHENKSLKMGDIIKVIVDRKLGNLSFEINGENYGIACSNIPKDDILYPIVMITDQGQIVEILE